MTNFRILSNNHITSSTMIKVVLQKTGIVTNPIKDGTGKATMKTVGNYRPGVDNQYKVQIESLSTAGIGVAKFKWSRNDTVITSSVVTNTAFTSLEDGVQVKWSSGLTSATDAFGSTLDQWIFEGKNLFGINQMIDRKRNTRWRSSTNARELHTKDNAMSDPFGNESSKTQNWTQFGAAVNNFGSTNTTVSAGSYSLIFDAATAAAPTNQGMLYSSFLNPSDIDAALDISMDISLKAGEIQEIFNDGGPSRELFRITSTGDFVSKSNRLRAAATSIDVTLRQLSTDAVVWYADNFSLKVLPGHIIDLGVTKEVQAVIIQDHNLTSNAEITLKARGDTSWHFTTSTSEPVDETITWADDKILHYVVSSSNTQRYWRVDVSDTGNPDGYIEIGNLYLGPYDEMVRNAAIGYSQIETVIGSRNIDPYGVEDNRFRNRQKTWQYKLPASTDIKTLEGVFDNIYSSTSGKYDPVWINPTLVTNNDAGLPVITNLTGYWNLNETTGLVAHDKSGNLNHGTITNGEGDEWISEGIAEGAIRFDAANEEINCGNDTTLDPAAGDYSISFWMKGPDYLGVGHFPVRKINGKGFIFSILADGKINLEVDDGGGGPSLDSITDIDEGNWHHIVGAFDRTNTLISLYIDGTSENSASLAGLGTISDTADFLIGDNCNGLIIDEVRVYKGHALTAAEVKALYLYPAGRVPVDFHMVHLDSLPLAHRFSNKSDITLNFREVLKSN